MDRFHDEELPSGYDYRRAYCTDLRRQVANAVAVRRKGHAGQSQQEDADDAGQHHYCHLLRRAAAAAATVAPVVPMSLGGAVPGGAAAVAGAALGRPLPLAHRRIEAGAVVAGFDLSSTHIPVNICKS